MKSIIRLVRKVQKDDKEAFLTLFQQYEQDLYRIAYVYLKNQDDAMDAVQETAYRAIKSLSSLKEPRYFKTWLIRIAISCSIDLLRQRKKTIHLTSGHKEQVKEAAAADLALSLSLKEIINDLDEEEKGVIILRFYVDCTIKETAELLEIPLGTCKTILYRALRKLRTLTKEGEVYED